MEEAKKMKCYKKLIYKQFVQVSGLCGPQFLSYLPKRFTHLCRALYGDAILVYSFGAPIWPPEINKNTIWSSLFQQKLFLFTRELAYMRINISSNTWNGYTAENQGEGLFSTRQHSYFGVSHSENSRSTQREILRKRPKNNNKAWIKLFEAILSILGDCWEKFICSSLPARLMEDDAILNIKSPQTPWIDFCPTTLSFQEHIISPKSPRQQKFAWRTDILRSRSIVCPWNSEVQIDVFLKWTCYENRNLYRDLFFVYLQPSVNKNS